MDMYAFIIELVKYLLKKIKYTAAIFILPVMAKIMIKAGY